MPLRIAEVAECRRRGVKPTLLPEQFDNIFTTGVGCYIKSSLAIFILCIDICTFGKKQLNYFLVPEGGGIVYGSILVHKGIWHTRRSPRLDHPRQFTTIDINCGALFNEDSSYNLTFAAERAEKGCIAQAIHCIDVCSAVNK